MIRQTVGPIYRYLWDLYLVKYRKYCSCQPLFSSFIVLLQLRTIQMFSFIII